MTTTLAGLPADIEPMLRTHWPDLPWDGRTEAHGAFHHVLLLPPVAVLRVRTGSGHAQEVRREHAVAGALAAAGLAVPGPLGEVVHDEQWSAMALTHAAGTSRTATTWSQDRAPLLRQREAWDAVGEHHPHLAAQLPPARTWCGGADWPAHALELTGDDPAVQDAARRRIEALLAAEETAPRGAVHGDAGWHNMLWGRDRTPILIDTDHAAWADPAIDIAPLLADYPPGDLAPDVAPDLLDRAVLHRRLLSLQVAAAADLRGDDALREHARANFARRVLSGDPQW